MPGVQLERYTSWFILLTYFKSSDRLNIVQLGNLPCQRRDIVRCHCAETSFIFILFLMNKQLSCQFPNKLYVIFPPIKHESCNFNLKVRLVTI